MKFAPRDLCWSVSDDGLDRLLRDLAFAPRLERAGSFAPGERAGRFEILREIGRGGFGLVYEARDTELGRHVAIKVLRIALLREADEAAMLTRLRGEAEASARLSHPNVVTLHDFGMHGGVPFLVFELLPGETLRSRLRGGRLPLADALDVAVQAARGLAHAHQMAIVHRDLNPNNIFLLPDGRVKILDFGLARLREALAAPGERGGSSARAETGGAGTPAYMAPEQWEGTPASPASDVFSAGAMLYEMLAGQLPFAGPDGARAAGGEAPPLREVPGEIAALVARALRRKPEERFANGAALLAALLEAQRAGERPLDSGNPYRYLDAFTEADEGWFFAREGESARLRAMLATHALVGVVGPSGAGKSSLVQAGLVPRLRREGWTIAIVRPGADPLWALAEQARRQCEGAHGLESLAELAARPAVLGAVLRDHARKRGARVLLFVDQLEELYTHETPPEARAAFAAALLLAADDAGGPVRVVVALREDHLSRLSATAALRDELSRGLLLLGPPDAAGLVEALRGPARRMGYELEEGLGEEVAAALARDLPEGELVSTPLPVLQLTASRLWDKRDQGRRVLSFATLSQLRGVSGIIATHAEEVFQALGSAQERQTAKEILLALVTPERTARSEERTHLLERFAAPAGAARILEHLVRGRLLVALPAREAGQERVRISHEALVRGWGRLSGWLDELNDERARRDRLARAAAQWVDERRPAELLWSGKRLREELSLASRYAIPLSAPERAFLEESRARRRKQRLRGALSVLAAIALAGAATVGALRFYRSGEHRIAEASSSARVSAIVAAAAGAEDPLLGALLLSELDGLSEPPGGMRAARRIAQKPIPLHLLRGHEGPVLAVVFDRTGEHALTASFDGTVRVWRSDGRGDPVVLHGTSAVTSLALDASGKLVAAGAEDGSVRLWRWGEPSPAVSLGGNGHGAAIVQLAFSRDGARLLSASRDGAARVWPVDGPGPARVLHAGAGESTAAAFSPDGASVATGSRDGSVRIWPLAPPGGAPLLLRGHRGEITSIAFDAAGASLLTASADGAARLWRIRDGQELALLGGHAGPVRAACFSPDDRSALTASDDGTARLWTLGSAESPLILAGHTGALTAAAFSPDSALVATASRDGTVRLWPSGGPWQPRVLRLPPSQVVSDGSPAKIVDAHFARSYLLTQNTDGTVGIWRQGQAAPAILGKTSGVLFDVFLSPDDSRILGVAGDGEVLLWSAQGPAEPLRLRGHTGDVLQGAFSPDGSRVVTASRDGTARIFRTDGAGEPLVLKGHEGAVRFAVFTPDGERVITAAQDGTLRIWRADGQGEPRVLRGHENRVNSIDLSPDGGRFVSASFDGTARVWPLGGSAPPVVLRGHGGHVRSAVFSPDGARIATASADGTARVWRADGASEPVVLTGHEGMVLTVKFSPDGARVITNSLDRTVRLWRIDGIGEPEVFQGLDTDFSRDGSLIVTPLNEGAAHVWIIGWQAMLRALRSWTTVCLTAEERARFLAEPAAQARARYESCQRDYGRSAVATLPAVQPPKDPAASVLEPDTDIWALNYTEFDLPAPAPEPCRKACIEDARCRAFSVSPPGALGPKARCYLKDGPLDRRFKPGNVSGIVR